MAQIDINIDFRKYTSHVELVRDLSPAFRARISDTVYFRIDLNVYSILYSDFLLLVSTVILHLRQSGIQATGRFISFNKDQEQIRYASRVNFFDLIGIPLTEEFQRWPGLGTFTEIKSFNGDQRDAQFYQILHREIFHIIMNVDASREMLEMLDFCLTEIFDNSLNHSAQPHGWACAQYFPSRKRVRLIVADTGVGIHQSLTQNPVSKFKHLNEQQAVLRCIQRGVTSGSGMGNGLYFTSEFIKKNGGQLLIYSGSHYLRCNPSITAVERGYRWNGTFVFMEINTDVPVDHREIMGESSTRSDDFDWFFGENQDIDNNLW